MSIKDLPDPTVDWDNIRYNTTSDAIRPSPGYRFCNKCKNCYPINSYYFAKYTRSPDGYQYTCKNCNKESRSKNK